MEKEDKFKLHTQNELINKNSQLHAERIKKLQSQVKFINILSYPILTLFHCNMVFLDSI